MLTNLTNPMLFCIYAPLCLSLHCAVLAPGAANCAQAGYRAFSARAQGELAMEPPGGDMWNPG